jgi:hypothetical protein
VQSNSLDFFLLIKLRAKVHFEAFARLLLQLIVIPRSVQLKSGSAFVDLGSISISIKSENEKSVRNCAVCSDVETLKDIESKSRLKEMEFETFASSSTHSIATPRNLETLV